MTHDDKVNSRYSADVLSLFCQRPPGGSGGGGGGG